MIAAALSLILVLAGPSQRIGPVEFAYHLAKSPWPAAEWATVWRVAACESGDGSTLDPRAENGQHLGALQIDATLHNTHGLDLLNLDNNLRVGYEVQQAGGYGMWDCY